MYSGSDNIDEVAWYDENSGGQTHPVGQKKGNGFGIHDMSGNVWEWVWDSWKESDALPLDSSTDNPFFIDEASATRVRRGGGWNREEKYARVSFRYWDDASNRYPNQGFRFLRTL